jgi:hypothetical protein
MADPGANDYIVRDIALGNESWRWTYAEPTLKFTLTTAEDQHFLYDFVVAGATLKDTGPVTLSIYINGRLLTRVRCKEGREYHVDKVVPAEWLSGSNAVLVRAVVDKLWTAPQDGARLGYLLLRAGFRK